MVTVSIILILTALGTFTLSSRIKHYRLSKAVNLLYGDLQFARTRAISTNYVNYINFVDKRTYKIQTDMDNDGDIGTGTQSVTSSSKGVSTDIEILNPDGINKPTNSDYIFYPNGSITIGGTLPATCQIIIRNTSSKECYGITLNNTGMIRIEKKKPMEAYQCTCPS